MNSLFSFSLLLILLIEIENKFENPNSSSIKNLNEDMKTCENSEYNEDLCYSTNLKSKNAQCCLLETINQNGSKKTCSLLRTSIKEAKKLKLDKMILKNEEIGFSIFEYGIPTKEEEEEYLNSFRYKKYYKCKDGNINMSVGYNNYSSSDKKAFNSIHHCFKYYRNQLIRGAPEDFNISKDDCFKADLSQSSRDAGIECGYFEYKLNSKNGLSETFKTCSPFDFDSFVKVGRYEDFTKSSFSRFAEDYGLLLPYDFENFTVYYIDSKGNSFIYNSVSNEITIK